MEFKISLLASGSKFIVQLLLNKELERINSELLYTYVQLDSRVRHLCLLVKAWNKQHFKNVETRLNSYTLVLMMIAYLQKEGVLPYLQNLSASLSESQRRTITFNKSRYKTVKGKLKQISKTEHTADITYEQSY